MTDTDLREALAAALVDLTSAYHHERRHDGKWDRCQRPRCQNARLAMDGRGPLAAEPRLTLASPDTGRDAGLDEEATPEGEDAGPNRVPDRVLSRASDRVDRDLASQAVERTVAALAGGALDNYARLVANGWSVNPMPDIEEVRAWITARLRGTE